MSVTSIELQVISRILTSQSESEIDRLCEYDPSYYGIFRTQIEYILDHRFKYNTVPDLFTFQARFPDTRLLQFNEPMEYLVDEMCRHKRHLILVETFNKIKDLGADDTDSAWKYIEGQCERAASLDTTKPLDLVSNAKERADQILQYNNQRRIPTGFSEIDKAMYGGLSTVEELLVIIARTGSGKTWISVKMMESAQKNGFPVLYYSPEMQASFLGTRFDTWRAHFNNSDLHLGRYDETYMKYVKDLSKETTSAYVLEDKDVSSGIVSVGNIEPLVKRYGIKLLVIDGLSYMQDTHKSYSDYDKYKNICNDLFRLSKKYGCAVVVVMQANRATKDSKDEKGEPFPDIYNIEGSDHPARIATQVFSVRQIFDKHVLDIRMEKSRNANNQRNVFSYSWDTGTGTVQYISDGNDANAQQGGITPVVSFSNVVAHGSQVDDSNTDDDFDADVEF